MEQAVGHHLAGQENRDVTARVRRAEQAAHERAGLPHLIGPARERRTLPNRRPSHPRTRPSPAVPPRDTPGQQPDAGKCTLDSAANVKPERTARLAHLRATRGQSGPAASTHTAPWPRFPSAMCPWTPQHDGLQRDKVTHAGTEQKRPA